MQSRHRRFRNGVDSGRGWSQRPPVILGSPGLRATACRVHCAAWYPKARPGVPEASAIVFSAGLRARFGDSLYPAGCGPRGLHKRAAQVRVADGTPVLWSGPGRRCGRAPGGRRGPAGRVRPEGLAERLVRLWYRRRPRQRPGCDPLASASRYRSKCGRYSVLLFLLVAGQHLIHSHPRA